MSTQREREDIAKAIVGPLRNDLDDDLTEGLLLARIQFVFDEAEFHALAGSIRWC